MKPLSCSFCQHPCPYQFMGVCTCSNCGTHFVINVNVPGSKIHITKIQFDIKEYRATVVVHMDKTDGIIFIEGVKSITVPFKVARTFTPQNIKDKIKLYLTFS